VDRRHGQDGRDDSESRQDRGIANFRNGFNGQLGQRASLTLREAEVSNDVFDDDNRVVDENANAEDEREERHPVERVAQQIKDAERKRQGDRDGEQDDARFSPT
jgi:hypothetical protein